MQRFDLVTRRLSGLRAKYQEAVLQATTGNRINAPSDDPVAAAEAARVEARQAQAAGNRRTVDLVKGDVIVAEAALEEAGNVFQRARELAMAGVNGANGQDQRLALAAEAQELVGRLVGIANTKGTQGYLFAGTQWNQAAFDAAGNFLGNDSQHLVETGTGEAIASNVSGAQAFTAAGGQDAFQTLRDLVTGLENNDLDAMRASLDALEESHNQILRERSHAGLVLNRLELSTNILDQVDIDLAERRSEVVGADTATTLTQLTQLENAVNNSITVAKRLFDVGNLQRF